MKSNVKWSEVKTLIQIVITGQKGGTGKTTITALLTEYLLNLNKKVQLVDTDPSQLLTNWIANCEEKGRQVSQSPANYQITDVAGVGGASLTSIKKADIILIPFIPHYADLQVVIPWFLELPKENQKKVFFLPNRFQNTKEQREGLRLLNEETKKLGSSILSPFPHRPALFSALLNGNKENFFSAKKNQPLQEPFTELFTTYENPQK